MAYGPSDLSIAAVEDRPYGQTAQELIDQRERRATAQQAAPATPMPPPPQADPGGAQRNPGDPMDFGGETPPPPDGPPPGGQEMLGHPGGANLGDFERFAAQFPSSTDRFNVLAPVGDVGKGIGDLVTGGFTGALHAMKTAPNARTRFAGQVAEQALGAVGTVAGAPLGIPAATSGSEKAQQAFAGGLRTIGGDPAGPLDIGALARALNDARQARGDELAGIAGDTTQTDAERVLAALGAGLYNLLPNIMPIPLVGEAAGLAKGVAKVGARAADALPGALEGAVGKAAPGAGAFASREAARVTEARTGPKPEGDAPKTPAKPADPLEGKRVEFSSNGGPVQGTVKGALDDGVNYLIEKDDGSQVVVNRFTPVRDEAQKVADSNEVADSIRRPAATAEKPTTVTETYLPPEEAARFADTSPLSERNEAVRRITGVNPSRLDPWVNVQFAEAARRDPEAFVHTRTVGDRELVQRAASMLGMTTEDLGKKLKDMGLTDPGEVASTVVATNIRVAQLTEDYFMATAARDTATAATAKADLYQFASKVGGANSELGRALRGLQLQRSLDITGALRQREVVGSAKRAVDSIDKAWKKAQGDIAKAALKGDVDLQKTAEAAVKREEQRLSEAKVTYQSAKDKLAAQGQKAKAAAFLRAQRERPTDEALSEAILAIDPTDSEALVKTMWRMDKHGPLDGYTTAVLSGAYSGPLGHIRSAVGAALNTVDNTITSMTAQGLGLPGFSRGELRANLMGLVEAQRTFGTMTTRYWKDRISPEVAAGGKGFEDIRGPVLTGAARPLGLTLEAHGFYHNVAYHIIGKGETFSYAWRKAERMGGDTATNYANIMRDLPDDVVEYGNKVAMDRRYLNKQANSSEALLKLASLRIGSERTGYLGIGRILFPAARFGIGAASRGIEVSGGGLVRALKMGVGDVRALERRAIGEEARLRAIQELGADAKAADLARRAEELAKNPSPELRHDALARVEPERDYLIREASKAGVRGALGAGMLIGGLLKYQDGSLRRNGFETDVDTPFGPMNVTWLMPYSTPLVFASIIGDALKKGAIKDDEVPQLLVGTVQALTGDIVDSSSLSTISEVQNVVNGKGGKPEKQFVGQLAARLAGPGFGVAAREADRILDGGAKDPRTWADYVKYYLPLARRALHPKIDPLTGETLPDTPQGAQRLNPAAVYQPNPPSDPTSQRIKGEDARLVTSQAGQDANYKGAPRATATWGTGKDEVKLTDEQSYQADKTTAEYRRAALDALTQSPNYQKASDQEKIKQWKAAEENARRAARRDLAIQFATDSKTDPRTLPGLVKSAYNANGEGRTTTSLWLGQLLAQGKLTEPVKAQLDKLITTKEKALRSPYTVANYLRAAPLVSEYLKMRPFTTGDPAEWAQLKDQRAEYSALQRHDPKQAEGYYRAHPLLRRYDSAENGARVKFLEQHPEVKDFVANTTYAWVR